MPCYHPLTRIEILDRSRLSDTGKYPAVIDSWVPLEDRHGRLLGKPYNGYPLRYTDIPCGQCIGCRLEHARQWSDRIMLEASLYPADQCWFVTITYNDLHLPYNDLGIPTLNKRDPQLFFKRLRKHCSFRYYLAGEYGDESFRPHYHMCLFGVSREQLQLEFYRSTGNCGQWPLYNSPLLQSCWTDTSGADYSQLDLDLDAFYDRNPASKGYIVIAPLTWDCANYVARYVTKKLRGPLSQFYIDNHLVPPYAVMSRRPGLAADRYYDGVINETHLDVLPGVKRPHAIRPPKYYERIFEHTHPEQYALYKDQKRQLARQKLEERIAVIQIDYLSDLARSESALLDRIKGIDFRDEI